MANKTRRPSGNLAAHYDSILGDISHVIDAARKSAARSVNCIMTAAYWLIGRRIVESEQKGEKRAAYGAELIERLSVDLRKRYGNGFSRQNLQQMRQFYLLYRPEQIYQTASGESVNNSATNICQTPSGILQTVFAESPLFNIAASFPLPWSDYVRLLSVKNEKARRFYETEALRGGWSVRQLDRQINSQFYERTAMSRNKATMLRKGAKALPEDHVQPTGEIKDPFVLEFLGLKDEYSETDLEEALIRHLESFLLELGSDFCFIGRQKRLQVGD
jgi:predicted nuclease of restriction endonuclease-like (RecB) superfamily